MNMFGGNKKRLSTISPQTNKEDSEEGNKKGEESNSNARRGMR